MTLRWSSWKSYKMMRCRRKWGLGTKSCVPSRGIDSVGVVYPVFPLGGVLLQWKIVFQFEFIQSIVRRQKIICGSKMYLYFCSLLIDLLTPQACPGVPAVGDNVTHASFLSPPLFPCFVFLPLSLFISPCFLFIFFVSPTILTEYFWFN